MPYNTGFPATYQQQQMGGYQAGAYAQNGYGQQMNAYAQPGPTAQQAVNYASQTAMTPPTIHAEIVQVANEAAVDTHPQAAGTSGMYMTQDEQHIIIKTQYAQGFEKVCYDRRPPEPPAPVFDPAEFVRRDELPNLIAQAVASQNISKKAPKKEVGEE